MPGETATTLLVLTDAESRLIRAALELAPKVPDPYGQPVAGLDCYNVGIRRGTERVAAEFAAAQKAKRPK